MTLAQQSSYITVTLPGSIQTNEQSKVRQKNSRERMKQNVITQLTTPDASLSSKNICEYVCVCSVSRKIIWENILMDKMGFYKTKVKKFCNKNVEMFFCCCFFSRYFYRVDVEYSTMKMVKFISKNKICFGQ